ncbi:MAG: hypothetical protein IT342_12525 [Candidatus Melainabacteria bacterium]|nr:hypothetical protein [Candidatus Melainabacteria bacterium]
MFEDKENEFEVSSEALINLTAQVTDSELEQLLSTASESIQSCAGGVCQVNWRPSRCAQAA